MTQSKLLEFLENIGISISAGHLSHLLIKNHQEFEAEKEEIYSAGLASSPWQHLDQTSARVAGVNQTTNIICNPFYTVYVTTAHKDRLSVLKVLQNGQELEFLLNRATYELLSQFEVPHSLAGGSETITSNCISLLRVSGTTRSASTEPRLTGEDSDRRSSSHCLLSAVNRMASGTNSGQVMMRLSLSYWLIACHCAGYMRADTIKS